MRLEKLNTIWLYFLLFCVFGAYAGVFILAFDGQSFSPSNSYAAIFFTGLFFYASWKQRSRKGWHGALIGGAIGFIVSMLAIILSVFRV